MARKENRKKKRILHLALIFTFTAIVFGTATYAWFIGMRTVNVNPFEVQIAATEDLQLSLDGVNWSDVVTINSSNYKNPAAASPAENTLTAQGNPYATNTNTWGGRGLIPMSSIGVINTTTSRLTLFEKGSLTATPGGYRLMASRVNNDSTTPDGYVAFDLFIKNSSGTEYYSTNDPLNEEAIYLTNDSKVVVGSSGVANTGIENSVRVAFAQIGRVEATNTSAATIQGITCASTNTGGENPTPVVTGICRTAQIWEPNDTDHVVDALSWYNTTCKARTGATTNGENAYGGACGTVVNGQAYPTYAIGKEIIAMNAVDVYDGAAYNGYMGDIATTEAIAISTESGNAGKYLYAYPYFTDTMKLKTGVERPAFITLAPNSITKVRVYIYIEGQDVDNYDFASIGKQISVNFGFTKERFTEDDINYQGPVLNQGEGPNQSRADIISALATELNLGEGVDPTEAQIIAKLKTIDKTAPVIKLSGSQNQSLAKNATFSQPTITTITDNLTPYTHDTTDNADEWYGPEGSGIHATITGTVNTAVPGTYRVLYEVSDEAGNVATEVVTVTVTDTQAQQGGGE